MRHALKLSFNTRLDQLVKFRDLKAPDTITCEAVVLLMKAAILLYGETFWERVHSAMEGSLRNAIGFCADAECNNDHRPMPYCPECVAKEQAQELEDML